MPTSDYHRTVVNVTTNEATPLDPMTYFSTGVTFGPNDTVISFRGPVHANGSDASADHGVVSLRYFKDTEYLWDRAGITVKTYDPVTQHTHIEDYVFQITLIDQNGWHL